MRCCCCFYALPTSVYGLPINSIEMRVSITLSRSCTRCLCVCSVYICIVYFAAGRNLHSLLAIIVCDVSGIIDWPIGQEDDDDDGDLRLMSS